MELLDRYVHAVRFLLPRHQRDDIADELRAELEAAVADQERARGRALTHDEAVALLRAHGHPVLVAARHRPQRSLIGPVVFPYYLLAIKLFVALTLATAVVGAVPILMADPSGPALAGLLGELAGDLLAVLGWTTVLGACADLLLARAGTFERWDSATALAAAGGVPAGVAAGAARVVDAAVRGGDTPRRVAGGPASLVGAAVGIALGLWFLLGLKVPVLLLGDGAAVLDWGPVVDQGFPLMVVATVLRIAVTVLRRRPDGRALRAPAAAALASPTGRALRFVVTAAYLVVVARFRDAWVVWRDAADAAVRSEPAAGVFGRSLSLVDAVNGAITLALLIPVVVVVVSAVADVLTRRPVGGRTHGAAAWRG